LSKADSPERALDVVTGCLEACRRCEAVVASVVEQGPSAFSTVGPHLRHCVDHFIQLLEGWRSGLVDYDARLRDRRLEQDPRAVTAALDRIASLLRAIGRDDLSRELTVTQSAAPGRPPASSVSRLERELVFLSGHTIHHIAIMVLAARAVGVEVPARLAVAYSTEGYRESLAVEA